MGKTPPGVMLYFNVLAPLKKLPKEQRCDVYDAIVEYAETGAVPDFSDEPMLDFAWEYLRPTIEKDLRTYETKVLRNKYAVYCRDHKDDAVPFDEWKECVE